MWILYFREINYAHCSSKTPYGDVECFIFPCVLHSRQILSGGIP
jgi:hypothetical protein